MTTTSEPARRVCSAPAYPRNTAAPAAISSGTPSSSRNRADARIRRIYAGTDEIKKYIIG